MGKRLRRERLSGGHKALKGDEDETERKCKVLQAAPGKDGTAITGSCRPKSGASTVTTPVANADFRTRRAGHDPDLQTHEASRPAMVFSAHDRAPRDSPRRNDRP